MSTTLDLDVSQIGPHLIGHRLEVDSDENGYRVGIRLVRYEVLTHDERPLYILYSDFAPVAVRVRDGAKLHVPNTAATDPRAALNGSGPAVAGLSTST
jgi:hypothetical protein